MDNILEQGQGRQRDEGSKEHRQLVPVDNTDGILPTHETGSSRKICLKDFSVPSSSCYDSQVYKSLETIIRERKIPKPPARYPGSDLLEIRPRQLLPVPLSPSPLQNVRQEREMQVPHISPRVGERRFPVLFKRRVDSDYEKAHKKTSLSEEKFRERKLDPRSHSLDEIIKHVVTEEFPPKPNLFIQEKNDEYNDQSLVFLEGLDNMEKIYKNIVTPYRALNMVSDDGSLLEFRMGRAKSDRFKDHLWRCIITFGDIEAFCDSMRKPVAREMASHELLKMLKKRFPENPIPNYVIPKELFIDPRVFHWIVKECSKRSLKLVPTTTKIESKDVDEFGNVQSEYNFQCTYQLLGKEFSGLSPDEEYAKLGAAKEVYEYLFREQLQPTKFFHGNDCNVAAVYDFF